MVSQQTVREQRRNMCPGAVSRNRPCVIHTIEDVRSKGSSCRSQRHYGRDSPFCPPRVVVRTLHLRNKDESCKETSPLAPWDNSQGPRPRRRGSGVASHLGGSGFRVWRKPEIEAFGSFGLWVVVLLVLVVIVIVILLFIPSDGMCRFLIHRLCFHTCRLIRPTTWHSLLRVIPDAKRALRSGVAVPLFLVRSHDRRFGTKPWLFGRCDRQREYRDETEERDLNCELYSGMEL